MKKLIRDFVRFMIMLTIFWVCMWGFMYLIAGAVWVLELIFGSHPILLMLFLCCEMLFIFYKEIEKN